MAGLIRRVLREVYRGLQAYGAIHVSVGRPPESAVPPGGEAAGPGEPPGPAPGPPAGHPERLCPDVALTAAERALERELDAES
ncbi:DUF6059 family protein [Streptomyces sp. NPDC003401]